MNRQETKQILALFRPESADAAEPDFAEALAEVGRDPDLRHWFEQYGAYQRVLRNKFRQIPVPDNLKEKILSSRKILRPARGWRRPAVLAAAAAILFLAVLSRFGPAPLARGSFENYRSRMVRAAIRQYGMDIVTNEMKQVRQFIAERGAPADYVLPGGLEPLLLSGGGVLRWRNNPVSMVCFDRGDRQMLFLFVVAREGMADPPSHLPALAKVNKLLTASWSRDDWTYLLAGPEEADFLKYIAATP